MRLLFALCWDVTIYLPVESTLYSDDGHFDAARLEPRVRCDGLLLNTEQLNSEHFGCGVRPRYEHGALRNVGIERQDRTSQVDWIHPPPRCGGKISEEASGTSRGLLRVLQERDLHVTHLQRVLSGRSS